VRWDAIVRAQFLLRLALLGFQTYAVDRFSAFVVREFFGDLSVVRESETLIVRSQLVDTRTDQIEKRIGVPEFDIREPPIYALRRLARGTRHFGASRPNLSATVEPNKAAASDPRLEIELVAGASRLSESRPGVQLTSFKRVIYLLGDGQRPRDGPARLAGVLPARHDLAAERFSRHTWRG